MELQEEELLELGKRVGDFVSHYLSTLGEGPVVAERLAPDKLRALFDEPLPRAGQGVDRSFQDFVDKIAANSVRIGHPRFLGWTRPSPLGAAVWAETLAAVLNQSVAVWDGAPAATEVELRVIEWLKELSGYAPGAGGLLTSGGSMANFICLLAARTAADPHARVEGLAGKAPFTIYITCETHYCVLKAAEMMGVGSQNVRYIPIDSELRMDPSALRRQIQLDRQAGFRPMAVAATQGTVSSGACDDLVALGEVCREQGVWLHVDGAYGGLAALVPEKRPLSAGLAEVDSLAFDPHKGLFMPFEAGCALVREPILLYRTFAQQADYLPNSTEQGGPFHFRDWGPQLSRSFRALKIYLAFKVYGTDAIADAVAAQYRLAESLGRRVQATDDFELQAPVPLGIVAFRYVATPPAGTVDREAWLDELNAQIALETQRRGNVFLAGTRIRGRFTLRACFVSFRTQEADLDELLEEIRAIGRTLCTSS